VVFLAQSAQKTYKCNRLLVVKPRLVLEKSALSGYLLLVRVFKNTWFSRFAAREGIQDAELKDMINILEAGKADANLGGGVYKVRVARSGAGKSGGYRVIVFFKSGDRIFYVYGFAKSDMGNISEKQLKDFKIAAKVVLAYSDNQLDERVKSGMYEEI
jgi:hypothetical protein